MKKNILLPILFLCTTLSLWATNKNHEDPMYSADAPQKVDEAIEDDGENKIVYSSIAGEAIYIETVDKHMRPLSCLLSINNENRYHYVAHDGWIAFKKDTPLETIHVFHDAKVYDFVPKETGHNKLTLVLNTKNQKYDLYENRVRKIKDRSPIHSSPKKIMVSNRY